MRYFFGRGYIKDGSLREGDGRIIIYKDKILPAFSLAMDHNYLLRAFASKFRLNKNEVINHAIRMYFRYDRDKIIVSGVSKFDDDSFEKDLDFNASLIKKVLR